MYAGAVRLAKNYDAQKIIAMFASGLRKIFPGQLEQALGVWEPLKQSAIPSIHIDIHGALNRQFILLMDGRTTSVVPDAG